MILQVAILTLIYCNYALAAGKVLMEGKMSAEEVAKKAIKVAADICVFTNDNVKIEKI